MIFDLVYLYCDRLQHLNSGRDVISYTSKTRFNVGYHPPMQPSSQKHPQRGWRRWWKPISIGSAAIVLNILAYIMLPPSILGRLRYLGYAGAFAVAAIANATVLIPVPYYPLIARLAQMLNAWGVILAAAAGSALGESVAFLVGRSGKGIVEETRINSWMHRQMRHP